jgi:hypothetical protein
MLKSNGQASVPRNVFPPTPPDPEGSNGNGLLRVQWAAGAWLSYGNTEDAFNNLTDAGLGSARGIILRFQSWTSGAVYVTIAVRI